MTSISPDFAEKWTHPAGHPSSSGAAASRVRVHVSTHPSATHSGADACRIVRREYLELDSLEPAQRCALLDRLYGIYRQTVSGYTRDEFETGFFSFDDIRIALFYAQRDELAGFSYASIERVEQAGRKHAVFFAGVYFLLGYRGGASAALFGLREAIRFKLRHPRTPLAYLTRSSSPAPYRLIASTMPRVYPSHRHQTPGEVEALVREVSLRRQYESVGEGPWIVHTPAMPHDVSRLRRLDRHPHVQFYTRLNPRFAVGNSLLTWVPLDAANLIGGLWSLRRARSTR